MSTEDNVDSIKALLMRHDRSLKNPQKAIDAGYGPDSYVVYDMEKLTDLRRKQIAEDFIKKLREIIS